MVEKRFERKELTHQPLANPHGTFVLFKESLENQPIVEGHTPVNEQVTATFTV